MAEICSANMEVRSPQPSFSASAGKGHFKKHIISVYNEEENLQQQAQTSQIPKTMPDLLPLPDDVPIHPKKRLKKDSDDPVLAEAAVSPMSMVNPCSPVTLFSKLVEGDERIPRIAANDTRAFLGSEFLLSAPNSPYASLPSPLDLTGLNDIPCSPLRFPFSPESINQENMPKDVFTINNNLIATKSPSFQDLLSPQSPQQKERLELSHQKPGVRPQSVALDLTSLPRQYFLSDTHNYHENPHHPFRANQQANPLPPPPPSCSIAQVLSERPNVGETKRGFQVFSRNADNTSQRGHPRLNPQTFDRPTGIVSPLVQNPLMYNRGCYPSLVHPYPPKQFNATRPPDIGGGVEVVRPKAYHAQGRYPHHQLLHHPQIGKSQVLPSPPGSQNKRAPSDMINYNRPSVFPRDMPQIALQPPTAVNKQVPWLLDDTPNIHPSGRLLGDPSHSDSDSFKNKPVHNWTYTDVIYFMFDAIRELNIKDQDLIISKLSGMTGKDLCNMTVEDFRKFLPKTGDIMHRYFFSKLQEERRQAAVASSQQENHINRLSSLETPSFDFVNSPNNPFYQPSHHPPTHLQSRQPPPSVLMREPSGGGIDTSAPYELRYETVDARAISGYDENTHRLLSGNLPSASGKSFDLLHAPSPAIPFDIDDNLSDPDQSSNEEEVKPEPPKKRGPGRPRKPENELKKKKKKTGRLWEFIRNLLLDPETCPSLVRWENPEEGVFRFVQAEKVAQKWGERKQNKDMNYEKLSRAMRYYYKGGVFEAVIGKRLVYKFGKNAKNWRPSNPNFTNHLPYSQSSSH